MSRVNVKPELFRWARERARMEAAALVERFPQYEQWESGAERPTFKQLEMLARKTMTPFGYFVLSEPPDKRLPIPDFRTPGDRATAIESDRMSPAKRMGRSKCSDVQPCFSQEICDKEPCIAPA